MSLRGWLAAAVAVLACGVPLAAEAATAAAPKKLPSTIYVDKKFGYRITVPRTWKVVPPSVAAVKQIATQLRRQKQTKLARMYDTYYKTAAGRAELKTFRFRAFLWPLLPSPVPTDVSVSRQKTKMKPKDLPGFAAAFGRQLAANGARVDRPATIKLPAGRAALVTGTRPLGKAYGGAASAFTVIALVHKGFLYTLTFRIDSRAAKDANVFVSIAKLFRFV